MTGPVPDAGTDPAGYLLAVADLREQRAKAAQAGDHAIHFGWLAERSDGCGCGAGGAGYPHEPFCEWEPCFQFREPFAEFVEPEANPTNALETVRHWRGIVERHTGDHVCSGRFPCPDLLAAVAAAQAYQAGAGQ